MSEQIAWPPIDGEDRQRIEPGSLDTSETTQRAIPDYGRDGATWGDLWAVVDGCADLLDAVTAQVVASRSAAASPGGASLDELGAAVGRPRNGLPDSLYRLAIQIRGSSCVGSGTHADLAALGAALGGVIEVLDYYPAAVLVLVWEIGGAELDLLRSELPTVLADGVGLLAVESVLGPLIESDPPFVIEDSEMS